jgi:hypothetical protein
VLTRAVLLPPPRACRRPPAHAQNRALNLQLSKEQHKVAKLQQALSEAAASSKQVSTVRELGVSARGTHPAMRTPLVCLHITGSWHWPISSCCR